MSQVYSDFGAVYEIYAGTTKQFSTVPIDPATGVAQDMTNTVTFATGYVDIVQADGTIIQANIPITYEVRTAGTSYVTWTAGPFTNNQAGNWMAFIKYVNASSTVIDQQKFNFKILESF